MRSLPKVGARGAAPQVPEQVEVGGGTVPGAAHDHALESVEQRASGARLAVHDHGEESTLGVHGHAAVEDEVIVAPQPHRPALHQEAHVLPELRTGQEGAPEPVDALRLLLRELLRMSGIEGGEVAVAQGVDLAVDLDRARGGIQPAQQAAVIQAPARVAGDRLPLELPLQDGGRLLHARHRPRVAQAGAFRDEGLRGIVLVHGAHEVLEGLEGDAVSLFELG